jgi:hypothetical protein
MAFVQSGIFDSCDRPDRLGEFHPGFALRVELSFAVGGEAVEAPSSLAGFFDPTSFDETLALEAIEEWVERSGVDAYDAAGFLLEELAELVSVSLLDFEEREDEHGGSSLLQFVCEHCVIHICGTPTV